MASITHQPNGRRTIQFVDVDGRRRSIRLGKASKAHAEAVKGRVESLLSCKLTGQGMGRDLALWVADLDETLHNRLSAVGLVEPRQHQTLHDFIEAFIASKPTVKATTKQTYRRSAKHLTEFFGKDRDLRKITPADADRWWTWLMGERGLSEATARKSVQLARQFMKAARRHGVTDADPFGHLTGTVRSNPDRKRFIEQATIERVLCDCPDAEWRLIVALARYGGLRIPSELNRLRWVDVLWDQNRFIVHASKTEHHRGGGIRQVPLFPELLPYFLEAHYLAPVGAEFVLGKRRTAMNLRTQFQRIIKRAGVEPWPKLFQNLRASRQTELVKLYPLHLVAAWLGNTPDVAMEHYLQVRDEDFDLAARGRVGATVGRADADTAGTEAKAVQNAVQQPSADLGTDPQHDNNAPDETVWDQDFVRSLPDNAEGCFHMQSASMGEAGFEPA